MREKIVLIDGHSILNRAFYGAAHPVHKALPVVYFLKVLLLQPFV